ncbi:MAG: hypothetical protein H7Z74_17465 [Anaerolineae bacterium]|nr:hypothetical protein [Gemmatimonadaceae bacterium]
MARGKRPDMNEVATRVVAQAIDADAKPGDAVLHDMMAAKRKSGRKGGFVRAAKLTNQRRSEIASLAAAARWRNKPAT